MATLWCGGFQKVDESEEYNGGGSAEREGVFLEGSLSFQSGQWGRRI